MADYKTQKERDIDTLKGFVNVLDRAKDELSVWVSEASLTGKVRHASQCGANNFCESMLPRLWEPGICPYNSILYRQAWFRGFFSAATWFLIDQVGQMSISETPKLENLMDWYQKSHPESHWQRVPLGKFAKAD